ncbi:MAG: hypothetical protein HF976_13040 [ANME-2 cluster archaeon]|nr:hypothetical protein [ANME-2 cluster archaeon]
MDNITKFNGVDYTNTFATSIGVMHELVKEVLSKRISNGDHVIDIGGGPGMGARIIDNLGIMAYVTNIEPSTTIHDVPQLLHVKYNPMQMSLKDALEVKMPYPPDCLLVVSAAHEIALCNNSSASKNKEIFSSEIDQFIRTNLKPEGIIVVGFPNYRKGASPAEIAKQRRITESILGHSHPPEELFTIEELSKIFGIQPSVYIKRPMNIDGGNPDDTILMANVAVFNNMDISDRIDRINRISPVNP